MRRAAVPVCLLLLLAPAARAQTAKELGKVAFRGKLAGDRDLSGIARRGDLLIVASDDTDRVQLLERDGAGYRLRAGADIVLDPKGRNLDLEGVAADDEFIYVVGSHSRARERAKPDLSWAENAERIKTVRPSADRDKLFRFKLDSTGKHSAVETTSVAKLLDAHPILAPFRKLPCKEGGIDIEGIAAHRGDLYLGFRGPVLNKNLTPILKVRFPTAHRQGELLLVDLGGRGVRDLARAKDGFLILAGPVASGPSGFRLYTWNGLDCLPGGKGKCDLLCDLPEVKGGKPEALLILDERPAAYEVLLLFDGLENGGPARYLCPRAKAVAAPAAVAD